MSTETHVPDERSFSEAMEELEGVLRRIEGDEVDIDMLARELGHAAELLRTCRAKIRRAEVEVQQIVNAIEEDAATTEGADAPHRPAESQASSGSESSARQRPPAAPRDPWDEEGGPEDSDDDLPF